MHHIRRWRKTLEAHRRSPSWQPGRPRGGAGRPYLVGSRALPRRGVLWCPLEYSYIVATKLSRGLFSYLGPP
jgi:hypothetical protein